MVAVRLPSTLHLFASYLNAFPNVAPVREVSQSRSLDACKVPQVLALDTLLALCLLACWLLRQPVMPADLLRWALDGLLPYLLLGDACAELLAAAGPHRPPVTALLPPGSHRPLPAICCTTVLSDCASVRPCRWSRGLRLRLCPLHVLQWRVTVTPLA